MSAFKLLGYPGVTIEALRKAFEAKQSQKKTGSDEDKTDRDTVEDPIITDLEWDVDDKVAHNLWVDSQYHHYVLQ